jgi:signal transduction histidine kinase
MEDQRNLLDSILVNSSNGISVTEMIRDKNGKVIDARTILANDAAVSYIGLPKEVFLSKTAVELDPNIIDSSYGQTCLKTLQTGEPSLSQYYMEITGRWQELTISKMDNDHLIHIFTDITPIKEAQLQLEHSVEQLKRSNINLGDFAYAASHDLKEPIRKIHVFADRLKDSLADRLTDNERMYFERMGLAAKRMNTLIEDLLTYSEVSQDNRMNEAVDINEVMHQVLSDLDLEIEQKGATVTVGKLGSVKGHTRQLQQAFHNLIGNALKYSRPGVPPAITIDCVKVAGADLQESLSTDRNRTYHRITVTDNGIGFEQADADRIFNVFTRLHGMAEYKGTGVGLSIVRKIIENHGGSITAQSQPGAGAKFTVLFPVG